MILGMVVGSVNTTAKADGIEGATYLLVEQCDQHGNRKGNFQVALDQIGAGTGEMIFMSSGSPNRQTLRTFDKPIDASILGIIDLIDQQGTVTYQKYEADD